ncbi:hypothetical protein [Segatella copri]|uniref:Uncharacterized protein n=1 Tax=Segatella copri TaxID=165179 RepID=A0A3R6GUT0_9BACT|nr:hypothetical protein [Segatella copri]RHH81427.1 hypothetical protein DW192_10220 [Segatella copri]
MTKEEAKEFYPILQVFAEGKAIECRTKPSAIEDENVPNEWAEINVIEFNHNKEYRIKPNLEPESEYRPFKDAEECWQEMLKHQPFGVVKDKYFANYQTHRAFTCLVTNGCHFRGYEDETFENSFKNLLFADGTPFGVKVEK